jgi:hypothetical protein
VASAYDALTNMEQWSIPVRMFHAFRDMRWQWNKPCFKGGTIPLDYRLFSIAAAEDTVELNLLVSISAPAAYKRVKVPFMLIGGKRAVFEELLPGWNNTNRHKVLLVVRGRHIHISISVEKERLVSCDVAMATAISPSNGKTYGKSFKELVKKEWNQYLRLRETRNKIRALKTRA